MCCDSKLQQATFSAAWLGCFFWKDTVREMSPKASPPIQTHRNSELWELDLAKDNLSIVNPILSEEK